MNFDFIRRIYTGAIAYAAALCFSAYAAESPTSEPLKETAQKLFLQKKRKEAVISLRRGMNEELRETAENLATLFLTDKGQKLFETGRARLFENPKEALMRFQEARPLEAGNLNVELSIARAQILLQDCSGAAKTLLDAEDMGYAAPDWWSLTANALLCSKNTAQLETHLNSWQSNFKWAPLTINFYVGRFELAHNPSSLSEIQKSDASHPLSLYVRYKYSVEQGQSALKEARGYLSKCQKMTADTKRKIMNSPEICLHLEEVEAYVNEQTKERKEGSE